MLTEMLIQTNIKPYLPNMQKETYFKNPFGHLAFLLGATLSLSILKPVTLVTKSFAAQRSEC